MTNIHERVVLAHLRIRSAGLEGRDQDRKIKTPLSRRFTATAHVARKAHCEMTLPFLDGASRLLPIDLFAQHSSKLATIGLELEQIANKMKMGSVFEFDVFYTPFPLSSHFEVPLGVSSLVGVRRIMNERIAAALDDARAHLRTRLCEAVAWAAHMLSPRTQLHANSMDLILERLVMVKALNVFDDDNINRTVQAMVDVLPPEKDLLRTNPKLRAEIRQQVQRIEAVIEEASAPKAA